MSPRRTAENTEATRTVAYHYDAGVHTDFDEAGIAQLRLAHDLWNEFVSIWKWHGEQKKLVWAEHPEVGEMDRKVDDLVEQEAIADENWQQSKIATRNREGDKELKSELVTIRAALRKAGARRKELKAHWYATEPLASQFRQLVAEKKAAEKATYADFVQARGLHYDTWNDVIAHYMAAQNSVHRLRNQGLSSDLRYRRWQGQGRLKVQLQRRASDPPRTPAMLQPKASRWANQAALPAMQEHKHRGDLVIRIGEDGRGAKQWMRLEDVIWHRPLPADADIAEVAVSRERVAGHFRTSVHLPLKLKAPPDSSLPGSVAIDTGWRVLSDGSIRVAVWRGKCNPLLVVHPHLADAIILDGEGGEVRIPAKRVNRLARCTEIQSQRDRSLEMLKFDLAKDGKGVINRHIMEGERWEQWTSPARFAALASRVKGGNDNDSHTARILEEWRADDKKLWEQQTHIRRGFADWRKDLYRNVGALLCDANSLVVVEKPYVAKVRKSKEDDTIGDEAVRKPAVLAAPALLTTTIQSAASARGVTVRKVDGKNTTLIHFACKHHNPPGSGAKSIMIQCEGCGEAYDQDINACWALLSSASD